MNVCIIVLSVWWRETSVRMPPPLPEHSRGEWLFLFHVLIFPMMVYGDHAQNHKEQDGKQNTEQHIKSSVKHLTPQNFFKQVLDVLQKKISPSVFILKTPPDCRLR